MRPSGGSREVNSAGAASVSRCRVSVGGVKPYVSRVVLQRHRRWLDSRLAATEGAMLARSIPPTSQWIPSPDIFSTRLNPSATTFVRSGERLTWPIRHELSSSCSPTFYDHRNHTGKLERNQCQRVLTSAQRVYSVRSPDHIPPLYLRDTEGASFTTRGVTSFFLNTHGH